MALTKSKAANIFTPEGNSLAVFIDIDDGQLKLKDVFGDVLPLSSAISVTIGQVDELAFNINYVYNSLSVGEMAWNEADGTVDLQMGNGVSTVQHIGQNVFYPPIVNKDSINLIAGTLVMADPTGVAQGNRIRVVRANSTGTYPAVFTVGILSIAIPKNQEGYATWFGYVRNLSLSALKPAGETWLEGDILYPNPSVAGGLTKVRPEAPSWDSTICAITAINGQNLTLFVRPVLSFFLGELNDVKDVSSTTGQVLMKKSTGIWENSNLYGTPVVSVATPSTHKIPVTVNGVTYYLLATNV
jgi:hypothetical protein